MFVKSNFSSMTRCIGPGNIKNCQYCDYEHDENITMSYD